VRQGGSLFPFDEDDVHAGSAQIALRANPPFDQIYFIDQEDANVQALEKLIAKSGHAAASVEHGDANAVLRKLCRRERWNKQRGVIFLDPFGMNVEWSTLELIAGTKALDVWFLFAFAGTVRNLPRLASRLDSTKRAAVTRVLGTDQWFDEFYKPAPASEGTLFDGLTSQQPLRRTAKVDDIERYVRRRLQTIFPYVEAPKRLKAPRNVSLFSLFFAVSNPNKSAIKLARRGASHILKSA
jgi:three-Cys-motif partner protein